MATVKSNRQNYYPPISPNPTAAEMALHLKNIYTFMNTTDQAVNLLNGKVTTPSTSSASGSSTSTIVTKTIIVSQLAGLGGLNDQTGNVVYTPTAADAGIFLIFSDAAPVAVTLNSALVTPYIFFATNYNSGVVTLTPTSGLINGAASWVMPQGGLFLVGFNGTNWVTSDVLELAQTFTAVTHQFLNSYSAATGLFTAARPDYSDLTGTPQLPITKTPVAGDYVTGYDSTTGLFSASTTPGISGVITTAALTGGGTQGSQTFTDGILTAQVRAT